jgi:hypothetical protein
MNETDAYLTAVAMLECIHRSDAEGHNALYPGSWEDIAQVNAAVASIALWLAAELGDRDGLAVDEVLQSIRANILEKAG